MAPAKVDIVGGGWPVSKSIGHPAGLLYSGGYDAELNTVYLAGVVGHPRGVSLGGGDPSKSCVSGLRVLQLPSGEVYWADDSMSLPRRARWIIWNTRLRSTKQTVVFADL